LTRRLLDFSHQDEPRGLEVFDMVRWLERNRETFELTLPATITLGRDFKVTEAWIKGNAHEIQQILMNLINNARDALAATPNPRIDLSVAMGTRPDSSSEGDAVVVTVVDNGPGVPEALRDKVLAPFFTTKPSGVGTGLGLAIARDLAARVGGSLRLIPTAVGARFDVELPRVPKPRAEEARDTSPPPEGPAPLGDGEVILLVDDNEVLRKALAAMLLASGYRVHEAADGVAALATFEQLEGRIDVVLSDLHMPNMNGAELIERLRERREELPVMLMSGGSSGPDGPGTSIPRCHILQKPLTFEQLNAALQNALRGG